MSILKAPFRILKLFFLHCVWFLSGFFPRDKKIWVLGSGHRFGGNSRWFYLYLQSQKKIRPVWITSNKIVLKQLSEKKWKACSPYSLEGIFYLLRAGIYIFNIDIQKDIYYFLSRGAKKVNLWHGIPIKKGGYHVDLKGNYFYELYKVSSWKRARQFFYNPWEYDVFDVAMSTSKPTQSLMADLFRERARTVESLGYPCNDYFSKSAEYLPFEAATWKLFKDIKGKGEEIILYVPTYRDLYIHDGKSLDIPLNWEKLNQTLEEIKSYFLIKLHPIDKTDYSFLKEYKRIRFIDSSVDIYPLFRDTDVLITDYSSICYDFLLLDKPIIFFGYDIDDYQARHRKIYEAFFDHMPGELVKDSDRLLDALKEIKNNPRDYMHRHHQRTLKAKEYIHRFTDSESCRRIYHHLLDKWDIK